MDSLITAAAAALAAGDPLGALKRVALRDDAPALALRGIAMAQLGDFARARALVRRAAQVFGAHEPVARARCVVAEAEIALVSRELTWPADRLDTARRTLERHGDRANAAQAVCVGIRRLLLVGRVDAAARALTALEPDALPPALRAAHALLSAGIAVRRVRAGEARRFLDQAWREARAARIPALIAEIASAIDGLDRPAARRVSGGEVRPLRLADVEALESTPALVIDACRLVVRTPAHAVSLARRPVLFVLASVLGEAWPQDASRAALIARAFGGRDADESHRARLRVEMGRLRRLLRPMAGIEATPRGFVLRPRADDVAVLARPVDTEHAAVLAFLADGERWSTSALALALNASQRTVQRALDGLAAEQHVQWMGRGRARRWMVPAVPRFATALLLPAPLPGA